MREKGGETFPSKFFLTSTKWLFLSIKPQRLTVSPYLPCNIPKWQLDSRPPFLPPPPPNFPEFLPAKIIPVEFSNSVVYEFVQFLFWQRGRWQVSGKWQLDLNVRNSYRRINTPTIRRWNRFITAVHDTRWWDLHHSAGVIASRGNITRQTDVTVLYHAYNEAPFHYLNNLSHLYSFCVCGKLHL